MTVDRRNAIVRLLDTRHEHLPEPVRRSEASHGFVHHTPARVSCPDCLANGKAMFGCETCGGRGYTEEKRERDPYATDAVVPYGLDGSRHELTRDRDRQIKILDQQLRPASKIDELADANANPYSWERARKRMYQLFDYAALDRALEALHHAFPGRSPYAEAALEFLDERLPDPLRAPAFDTDQDEVRVVGKVERAAGLRARDWRDVEICRAVLESDISTSDVARAWGISVSQVNKIVKGEAA